VEGFYSDAVDGGEAGEVVGIGAFEEEGRGIWGGCHGSGQ